MPLGGLDSLFMLFVFWWTTPPGSFNVLDQFTVIQFT
jgi:hypothetical protein